MKLSNVIFSSTTPAPEASACLFVRISRWIAGCTVYLLLGAIIAHVSLTMHPRFLTQRDSIGSQRAIYDRTPATFGGVKDDIRNWRNRVMIPYWLEFAANGTGLTYGQAYVLTRWLTASLALAAFALLLWRGLAMPPIGALAGSLLLALALIPTFTHIYEIPSDFLDAAFFSVLALLALQGRRWTLFALMMVALLNRESAIFAVPVWFMARMSRRTGIKVVFRELFWCAVIGSLGTAWVLGIRILNSDQHAGLVHAMQSYDPTMFWATNVRLLQNLLTHPTFLHPYFYLSGYLLILVLTVGTEWRALSHRSQRLLIAAAAIFGVSIVSNNLDELRIFIPSLVLTSFALVDLARRRIVLETTSTRQPIAS